MPFSPLGIMSLLLAVFLWDTSAYADEPRVPQTQPSSSKTRPGSEDEQAIAAIKKLLDGGSLRLSTDERSAAGQFSFLTELAVPTPRGGRHLIDYWVARDKEKTAVIVATADGLPYCYLADGLMVMFDPTVRGQLMVYEGGSPSFTFTANKERNAVSFLVTYSRHAQKPVVQLAPDLLLEGSLNRLRRAEVDPKGRLLTVHTEHGMLSVRLPPPGRPAAFPIQGMMFVGADGLAIALSDISANAQPPRELFTITRKSIEELNVPVRILGDKEILDFKLIVPPSFPSNDRERAAAEKLRQLFPSLVAKRPPASRPATQPATQPAPNPKPRKLLPFPRSQRVRIMDEEGGRNGPIQTASPALDSAPSSDGVYRAG